MCCDNLLQVPYSRYAYHMAFDYLIHGLLGRPYRLHTKHSGNQRGPVIVLLHGIAASGEDWHHVLPHLEPIYHCVTIDLLGFGSSPKPQWARYTMDDHVRSLDYTMRKLRLKNGYILIGHSLGSFLAARYTKQHEANIGRLFLLSPPVYPPLDSITERGTRKLTGILLSIYKFLRSSPRVTPELFKKLTYIAPLPRSIVKHPETWVPFMRSLQECIEQQTILEDVASLNLPIDVCYGTLDQVVLGPNVHLLEKANVRIHKFMNTHDLTNRYGMFLAKLLVDEPISSKAK